MAANTRLHVYATVISGKNTPPPYKRTGEKLDGRPILEVDRTGENGRATIFCFFKGKTLGKSGKIPGKNWTGDKKRWWWTGDTEISPVLLYGGGVC